MKSHVLPGRDQQLISLLHDDIANYGVADLSSFAQPNTLRRYVTHNDALLWVDAEQRWASTAIRNPLIEDAYLLAMKHHRAATAASAIPLTELCQGLHVLARQRGLPGLLPPAEIVRDLLLIADDWVFLLDQNALLAPISR